MFRPAVVAILLSVSSHAWSKPPTEGEKRVAAARQSYGEEVRTAVEEAGLKYPPREIFVRVFKFESVLEIWARDKPAEEFKLVFELPLDHMRVRGRKKREGDFVTPEGFYRVVDFNPESAAYLSLKLDYPNEADRIHAAGKDPGSLIFIHGAGYSTGCVSVAYPGIAQLYVLALDVQRRPIHVHLFPHRFNRPAEEVESEELTRDNSELAAFWEELRVVYDVFESTKRLPQIRITKDGHYALVPEKPKNAGRRK